MKPYQVIKHNGLTIILSKFNTKSIFFDFAFNVGSRYEDKTNNGISHFIEHLYSKAIINKLKSHPWITHYTDDTLHAYTMEDRMNFEFTIHKKDLKKAISLVSEITKKIKINKEAMEIEKGIIIEELQNLKDNVYFYYQKTRNKSYYKNSSLNMEILGTKKNIKKFTITEINEFIKRHCHLENMILTIAGNINIQKDKETIYNELKRIPKKKQPQINKNGFKNFSYSGDAIHIKRKKINRAYFGYYYPIFNVDAENNVEIEFFGEILNNYFFDKITDQLSIYSIDTDVRTYNEFINFSIESCFDYKKTTNFYLLLQKELRQFKKNFTQKDFNYFKERKLTNLELDKDDIRESINMIAWYALMFGTKNILTLSDQQKIIKSMDIKKIYSIFDLIFKDKKGTVIIFGEISKERKQKLLKTWDEWKI